MTPERWRQLEEIYDAALAWPADQRATFLAEACVGDEALRREVEALLDSPATVGFLAMPALAVAAQMASNPTTSVLTGRRLGFYHLRERIGAGGMGEVYRARDTKLGRDVAIKVLPHAFIADPDRLGRFEWEARVLATLNHPNIATIHGIEESDGVHAFVMELVEGPTLAERLARDAMPVREALALARQMADALDAAHEKGIIHRDLKPANIKITPNGTVKVLDFGLSKAVGADGSGADLSQVPTMTLGATAEGLIVGTPAYMSPEQARGQAVEKRTDIWAFGCVVYEMLTGRPAFSGATVSDTIAAILDREPDWQILPASTPPNVRRLLQHCLDKDVTRRLRDIGDARLEIEETLAAQRGQRVLRLSVVAGSRRAWVAAACALVLLAGGVGLFYTMERAAPATSPSEYTQLTNQGASVAAAPVAAPIKARRSVAVLGFKNLSGRSDAAWLSTALSEMLTTELAAGETLRTIPGEEVVRMKIDLALVDAESFGRDTLARIRTNVGTDLVVLGSYVALGEKAAAQIRLDLRVQDATMGETIASVTDTATEAELLSLVSRTGSVLREKLGVGELSAAQAAGIRASLPSDPPAARLYTEGLTKLRLAENLAARDLLEKAVAAAPNYPFAHAALATAWSALGYDAKAKDAARQAFELSGKLSREERLWIEGRYRQANDEPEQAIGIYKTLFNFSPDNLEYGLRLAGTQTAAGKGKDALVTVEGLRRLPAPLHEDPRIDIAEASAASSLSDFKRQQAAAAKAARQGAAQGARLLVARAHLEAGWAFLGLGEPAKAIAASEEAQRIYAAAGDRRGVAGALNRIAIVRRQQGELAKAKPLFEQVLATYRAIGDRRGVATIANNLANVLRQQARMPEARKMYEESLLVSREIGDKSGAALALHNMAVLFRQQGNLVRARTMYEEALAIRREIGEKIGVARTLGNLANVLNDQDDLAGAKKMHEESLAISREVGDKRGVAVTLGNIAQVLADQGNLTAARPMHEEALTIRRELGDKFLVADGLSNLATLLASQGELHEARRMYEEGLAIFREVGEKRELAFAYAGLGEVLLAQGDLLQARKHHEEALAIRTAAGEMGTAAESRRALAALSIEEGHPADAERLARQAAQVFERQKAVDDEALAYAVVARALLARGRVAQASEVMKRAVTLSTKSQNRSIRFSVAVTAARVDAALRKGDAARTSLEATLREATKTGLRGTELEARLALGELEMSGSNPAAGRARLAALEKEAADRSFGLISRKAVATMK